MILLIFLAVVVIFLASFRVPWLKKLRHRMEDKACAVRYPLYLGRGDAVILEGQYRVAQSAGVLKSHAELIAWIAEDPRAGLPTRQERGWTIDA